MQQTAQGWINGLIGVVIFSGSLPATRLAVADFDPLFLTATRAAIAGLLALALLLALRQPRPRGADLGALSVVALGVVIGFPLLTALALQHIEAAHSIVHIGLLPLATALFGVMRGGERPQPAFWLFSLLGALAVMAFSFTGGLHFSPLGDTLMVLAVILCGLGYAEGARLARRLGGWQVICWALVLALVPMGGLAIALLPDGLDTVGVQAWAGLAYVSLFSMLIGFFFWYRGLAQGGIAAVGQLQLLQPFFGLGLAALVLGETVTLSMVLACLAVIACVAGARHFR